MVSCNGYDIDKVKKVADTAIEKLHTQLREVNQQVTILTQLHCEDDSTKVYLDLV